MNVDYLLELDLSEIMHALWDIILYVISIPFRLYSAIPNWIKIIFMILFFMLSLRIYFKIRNKKLEQLG